MDSGYLGSQEATFTACDPRPSKASTFIGLNVEASRSTRSFIRAFILIIVLLIFAFWSFL